MNELEFGSHQEIVLDGDPPSGEDMLLFPPISCDEAIAWNGQLARGEEGASRSQNLLLLGHLVDDGFAHSPACPAHDLENAQRLRALVWK